MTQPSRHILPGEGGAKGIAGEVDAERPRVVVCACHGCPAAGPMALGPLPAGAALLHVPCGREFQPTRIIAQLLSGAEHVLIVGCAEGVNPDAPSDYEVEARLQLLRRMLNKAGVARDRTAAEWIEPGDWRRVGTTIARLCGGS